MNNERVFRAAQWLTALAVVFLPLSIIILLSGSWMVNFTSNQWTRYLLFASWLAFLLSVVMGVFNMISAPAERRRRPASRLADDGGRTGDPEEPGGKARPEDDAPALSAATGERQLSGGQGMLLAQATVFLMGLFLYMAFISWMILPEIALR